MFVHHPARVSRLGPQAAQAHSLAQATGVACGVHGKAVAAWPAARQLGLVAGEGEHAAPVGRVRGVDPQLVRDRVAAGRGTVLGPPHPHLEVAHVLAVAAHHQPALGEVRMYRPGNRLQASDLGVLDPADLAVLEVRHEHRQPIAAALDNAEDARRVPLGLGRQPQPDLAVGLVVDRGSLLEVGHRIAAGAAGIGGERIRHGLALRRERAAATLARRGLVGSVVAGVARGQGGHHSGGGQHRDGHTQRCRQLAQPAALGLGLLLLLRAPPRPQHAQHGLALGAAALAPLRGRVGGLLVGHGPLIGSRPRLRHP